MEVQFGLSWNGWSEYNLQFDAFKRSNLPLSNLKESALTRTRNHLFLFCFISFHHFISFSVSLRNIQRKFFDTNVKRAVKIRNKNKMFLLNAKSDYYLNIFSLSFIMHTGHSLTCLLHDTKPFLSMKTEAEISQMCNFKWLVIKLQ